VNSKDIFYEVAQISTLSHPNIVQYVGCYSRGQQVYIAMECMEMRLADLIAHFTFKRKFSELEIASVCREILKALKYIHEQQRIHRDVRSDTIWLNQSGNIKIGEFSLCCELNSMEEKRKSVVGVRFWMLKVYVVFFVSKHLHLQTSLTCLSRHPIGWHLK